LVVGHRRLRPDELHHADANAVADTNTYPDADTDAFAGCDTDTAVSGLGIVWSRQHRTPLYG
jgi:hypothetical protein